MFSLNSVDYKAHYEHYEVLCYLDCHTPLPVRTIKFHVGLVTHFHSRKQQQFSCQLKSMIFYFSNTGKTRTKESKYKNLQPEISQPILSKDSFVKQFWPLLLPE